MPSDRDASISDAAFCEALSDLMARVGERHGGHYTTHEDVEAARARVLALYAEAQRQGERDQLALAEQVAEATVRMEQGRAERQGEVYEVTNIGGICNVTMDARLFNHGDRVRVVRCEEEV